MAIVTYQIRKRNNTLVCYPYGWVVVVVNYFINIIVVGYGICINVYIYRSLGVYIMKEYI